MPADSDDRLGIIAYQVAPKCKIVWVASAQCKTNMAKTRTVAATMGDWAGDA